jgi:hypothetical protein
MLNIELFWTDDDFDVIEEAGDTVTSYRPRPPEGERWRVVGPDKTGAPLTLWRRITWVPL